ncbi:AbrB/MazE/SpoVT family DNA-binding domain-containing protein [Candidatus Saccharibacteria bacterium]|nr:AbrB/MazE/SpoVT family DNA-binding domain-containing protein [Candidatus Saccharibacteria bacterium]
MKEDLKVYGAATIGSKGQLVIPADLRAELDLKPGDKVVIVGSKEKQFVGILRDDVFQMFLDKLRNKLEGSLNSIDNIKNSQK